MRATVQARAGHELGDAVGAEQRVLRAGRPASGGVGPDGARPRCARRASVGRTPSASVTRVPVTTSAAAVAATPMTVWVRRRVAPGAPDDRGPRPAVGLDVAADGLEHAADLGRGDLAVQRERRGRGLQLALGLGAGEADLAGHRGQRAGGQLGHQQHPALGDRQPAEGVEGGLDLGVEALLAVPQLRRVPAYGVPAGVLADPGLRVLDAGDLAPVVPGDDEGVAHRGAGGREVASEAVRQQQQARADVLVELVELVGLRHGAVHGSPTALIRADSACAPGSGRSRRAMMAGP